jgi:hypothetical protein
MAPTPYLDLAFLEHVIKFVATRLVGAFSTLEERNLSL